MEVGLLVIFQIPVGEGHPAVDFHTPAHIAENLFHVVIAEVIHHRVIFAHDPHAKGVFGLVQGDCAQRCGGFLVSCIQAFSIFCRRYLL